MVHWLNAFPSKNGVSDTISPGTLLTGIVPDFNKHYKLNFGSYVQTHEENAPRNSMATRTIGAITLGPDNSQQGGYWFMSLNTGKKIHRRNWTPLPMSDEVVSRVEQLGKKDGQPNLLVFTDKHGENLLEGPQEDDDLSYASDSDGEESTGVDDDPKDSSVNLGDNIKVESIKSEHQDNVAASNEENDLDVI